MLTILDQTIELFEEARRESGNYYLYFELAYTKHTGWMCWLQDRTGGEANKKNLVPPGQADEPGVACVPVKQFLEAWKRNNWLPQRPPPLRANIEHPFDGKWKNEESASLEKVCDASQAGREEAANPKSVEDHMMENTHSPVARNPKHIH